MITELFIIFIVISLALLFAGKKLEQPPVSLAGFLIIFILGLTIMLGGLQYKNGENTAYSYNSTTLINQSTTYTYSSYDSEIISGLQVNHIIGFFLSITAVFGFIITLINLESFTKPSW